MPNYTITTTTTQEATGDSVNASTIPANTTLVITPDTGFVLDAADFSASTPLATGIASVVFTNSTTASALGNVVNVLVTYSSNLTMAQADIILNIGICGDATLYVSVPVSFAWALVRRNHDFTGGSSTLVLNNDTLVTNVQTSGSPTTTSTTAASSVINAFTIAGSYPQTISFYYDTITTTYDPAVGGTKLLASGTYTACHASENPNISITSLSNGMPLGAQQCTNGLDPTGYVCSLDPEDFFTTNFLQNLPSELTGYIDTLYYNSLGFVNAFDWRIEMSGGFTQAELDSQSYTPATTHSNGFTNITGLLGNTIIQPFLDSNGTISSTFNLNKFEDSATTLTTDGWDIPLNPAGDNRTLTFRGDPGALYSITFVDASGNNILSGGAPPLSGVVLPIPSNGFGVWTQFFPASASATTYTLVVTPSTNTSLSTLFTSRSPANTFIYTQSGPPTININTNSASSFSTSSSTVVASTGFSPFYRFNSTNNTFAYSMTITKVGGGNISITRQPSWPSDWSNSDPTTNGGTQISLNALSLSGSGTNTLTLSGTASRTIVGTSNATMTLALDNFINMSGSTVAMTGIALNTNPIASQTFDTGSSMTVNAVVTPENPSNPSLTWAISGSGFTLTPSTDTQSAVVTSNTTGTRTITCTSVSDSGVSDTIDVVCQAIILSTVEDEVSVYKSTTTQLNITRNDNTQGGSCNVVIMSQPTTGTLSVNGQTVTYAVDAPNLNSTSFTYKLTKTGFADSNTSTVFITLLQN